MRSSTLLWAAALLASAMGCDQGLAERGAGAVDQAVPARIPRLDDPVVYDNGYCTYQDTLPYVLDVRWDDPLVNAAVRALGPGYRSTILYAEWKLVYGLERESSDDHLVRKAVAARNFIRVLCGEHRDDAATFEHKLRMIAAADPEYRAAEGLPAVPRVDEPAHVYARAGEMEALDLEGNLFAQITFTAYERLLVLMRGMHGYRQSRRRGQLDGWHYGFRDDQHVSNRVDRSVPPVTHCEMKFLFERYLGPSSPLAQEQWGGLQCDPQCAADAVAAYDQYRQASCTPADFETMYDFRGHKVLQPLWFDSNAFVWASQRAGVVSNATRRTAGDPSYYLHPFASRYESGRRGLGTFLLYPEVHHRRLITASEQGGGKIMYVTDQDSDGDHLADYLLFDANGCGDPGPVDEDPATNCNMVRWVTAATTTPTARHASAWSPAWYGEPDLGFLRTFASFDTRMARINQALDRHTNWGPTGLYMPGAPVQLVEQGQVASERPGFLSNYSPFVATSYDVSASDTFARGNYRSTHTFERDHTKWMFVIRFRASDYYSEVDLKNGKPLDFDRHYLNETSLSNDFYRERGLDRFGWIPAADIYASIYFVYGSRGEEPEAIVDLPAQTD